MDAFVQALTTGEGGITAANLWSAIIPLAGFITALVLFKFGYGMVKNTTNKAINPNSKKVMR